MIEQQWLERMTDAEWRSTEDAVRMVRFLLKIKASKRKIRLLACCCCRMLRVWELLPDRSSQKVLKKLEVYADEDGNHRLLRDAHNAAYSSFRTIMKDNWPAARQNAARAVEYAAMCDVPAPALIRSLQDMNTDSASSRYNVSLPALVREVFSNQIRPVSIIPAWVSATVTSLATVAYSERALPSGALDPIRLTILADALEEAGCDQAELLNHLRSAGPPHYRGCWALDAVLGRE